ncbi:hypothetical protein AOLI_G00300190 [Acnodon oligacanthus]
MDLDTVASDDDLFGVSQHSSSQGSVRPAPRLRFVIAVPDMPAPSASSSSSYHCGGSWRSRRSPSDPPPAPARSPRKRRGREEPRIPTVSMAPALPHPSCSKSGPPSISDWTVAKLQFPCQYLLALLPHSPTPFQSPVAGIAGSAVAPPRRLLFFPSTSPLLLSHPEMPTSSILPSSLLSCVHGSSKVLTVPKFALTFSIYRNIICSAFPSRCWELDDYLSIILDLAVRFRESGFCDYHRLFSACACACLQ